MIQLIKNFRDIDFSSLMTESALYCSESSDSIKQSIDEVYKKGKEMAINLNDEIQKLNISETDTFNGTIHKMTFDVDKQNICPTCSVSDIDKNATMNVHLTAEELKAKLYRIPDLIYTTINHLMEHNTDGTMTCQMVQNVHQQLCLISRSALELIALTKINNKTLSEANEKSAEDVNDYISELKKVMTDIRNYYEKFDHAKLLTPRKKQIDKIEEYVKGALDRKYTLRVPLYKIENCDKESRDLVENKFIKDLQGIVAKYNNYCILSPNWDEGEDIFIYLTLKEPFGKEGDADDRKIDSAEDKVDKAEDSNTDTNDNKKDNDEKKDDTDLNESATKLSSAERNALPDSAFGLPKLRKYPLNDEAHIRQAIKTFHYANKENKTELANNISKKVKELKLVGKVTVSKRNPFKKYFPAWMIEGGDADDNEMNSKKRNSKKLPKTQNETVVFINDKLI